jgi:hypothetical protein
MFKTNMYIRKIFLVIASIILPSIVLAAGDELIYKLAAPIPGGTTGAGGEQTVSGANSFVQYMSFLFPFLLSVAAISALVMFIYGGIQYALGGANPEQLKDAKDRISNAIWGLLLAVFGVLVLQTINPNLIKLDLQLDPVGEVNITNTPAGGGGGGTTPTPTGGGGGGLPDDAACASPGQCASGLCITNICMKSNVGLHGGCYDTVQCTPPLTCKGTFNWTCEP